MSFFISGVTDKTVTRKIFEDIDVNLSPVIAAVSTIFCIATIIVMGAGQYLRRGTSSR